MNEKIRVTGLALTLMLAALPASAHELDFAVQAGGSGDGIGNGIAVDGSGAGTVTGYFSGTATFGADDDPNQTTLTSAGSQDIFVAKYNPDGTLAFAVQAGGTGSDQGRGIAVDGSGASTVTGWFQGTAVFGAGETNEITLTAAGGSDIFVARYNPDGTLDFAVQAGGTGSDLGFGIAVDGSGASTVTGRFAGVATFGAGETNETILTSAGGDDIFVARYNLDGTLAFAVQAGGTSTDQGLGIAVDGSGASTVTGFVGGMATFGAGETNETTLAGGIDIFVARYNPDGTLAFAVQAGGTDGFDQGFGIAVDGSGASTVTGYFTGTATFGAGELGETILTSAGGADIFVARYNPNGTLDFAVQAGGTSSVGRGIVVDGSGASTVTGYFQDMATFGAGELGETTLNSAGSQDIFVARYNPDGTLAFAVQAGGTGFDTGNGIAVDGSGASTVTGFFEGMATFGAGDPNQTTLTAAGDFDIFVAKYAGGSPEAQIEALIEQVDAAGLSRGIENSLSRKLSNAQGSLARGQTKGAIGKLNAFIHQVEAQAGKKIDVADADAWIADAQAIIDELEA